MGHVVEVKKEDGDLVLLLEDVLIGLDVAVKDVGYYSIEDAGGGAIALTLYDKKKKQIKLGEKTEEEDKDKKEAIFALMVMVVIIACYFCVFIR